MIAANNPVINTPIIDKIPKQESKITFPNLVKSKIATTNITNKNVI